MGDWSWEESQIANFVEYRTGVKSVWLKALILLGGNANGELFGMLALLLWSATIVKALRACAQFSMIVGAYESDGDVLNFEPSPALKVVVGIITVCRLVILVFLGIYGGQFLSYVDNLKDFILNSVALGFVIDIPDIFFNAFASNTEKVALQDFPEGNKGQKPKPKIVALVPSLIWDHSGGSSLLFGGVFYVFLHFKYFAPFVKNLITLVADPVCFNNTDNSMLGVQ